MVNERIAYKLLSLTYKVFSRPRYLILSLEAQNLPFQQMFPTLTFTSLLIGLPHDHGTGPDLSRSSFYVFFFSFTFFVHSVWMT